MTSVREWLASAVRPLQMLALGASRQNRIAVFLDGDGLSSRHANAIFDHAKSLGRVTTAHLHANFSSGAAKSWATAVRHHRIRAHQHFAETSGRNATDIELTVAAMDVLHRHLADVFILASSDSDLAGLARRLVEAEKTVHGIGAEHTPPSFRSSCTNFTTLNELHASRSLGSSSGNLTNARRPVAPELAEDLVLVTLVRMGAIEQWVSIDDLSRALRERNPSFEPRRYKTRKLSDLLEALSAVELDRSVRPARVRLPAATRNG